MNGTTQSELDRLNGLVSSLRREHGNRVAELHAREQTMAAMERENATLRRVAEAARAVARAPYPGAILAGLEAMGFALRDLDGEVPLSCAVVIPRDGRFAALRQVKRAGRIEVPGGKVAQGEHPEAAARREVYEEVGLHVTHLVPLHVGSDGGGYRAHVFLAQAIGELRSSPEGEALWATADELLEGSFGDFYSSSPAILLALGCNPFQAMPLGARTREDGPF